LADEAEGNTEIMGQAIVEDEDYTWQFEHTDIGKRYRIGKGDLLLAIQQGTCY